jgi:hypothetical protein
VRESCVGKRCLLRTRLNGRDSKQEAAVSRNCRAGASPAGATGAVALQSAARVRHSFQSEQSQPSSCSILEMSSANRL